MHVFFLILVGFVVGFLNAIGIRWTIKKLVETKNSAIVVLSFFLRMIAIFVIFYAFLDNSWKNAIYMLIGLTISKIIFILKERKKGIKK